MNDVENVKIVKIVRHHPPVQMQLKIKPLHSIREQSESISYDFFKANFNGMNAFLAQVDWDAALRDSDVNLAASTMSNILLYAIDQFVPVMSIPEPVKPAWSNVHLKSWTLNQTRGPQITLQVSYGLY